MSYNKHHIYDTLVKFIEGDDLLNVSYYQGFIRNDGERIKTNTRNHLHSRIVYSILKIKNKI